MLPSELTKAEVTITNPPQEALKLTMRLMSQSYGAHAAFLHGLCREDQLVAPRSDRELDQLSR
jgi:hypothetical protein